MKKFVNEINISVHSWNKFIFDEFFNAVPEKIEKASKQISVLGRQIT